MVILNVEIEIFKVQGGGEYPSLEANQIFIMTNKRLNYRNQTSLQYVLRN